MKAPRQSFNSEGNLDLVFEDGKFMWAEDGRQAAQHAALRLLQFKGEYSLNNELTGKDDDGFDIYGIVLDVSKSKAEKELEIKRVILETYGIEKILAFSWTQTGHTVAVTSTVKTLWGDATLSGEFEAL